MDVLKLGMHEVDQVAPPLGDLLACLHRVPQLPPDFEGKAKARDWVARLNSMRAMDKLDEGAVRQLAFDLDTSYTAFMRALGGGAAGAAPAPPPAAS
jgi:ESCRT-I complex subunit VPS28